MPWRTRPGIGMSNFWKYISYHLYKVLLYDRKCIIYSFVSTIYCYDFINKLFYFGLKLHEICEFFVLLFDKETYVLK